MQDGFEYIRDNGIVSESVYPYVAETLQCDKSLTVDPVAHTRGISYVNVP